MKPFIVFLAIALLSLLLGYWFPWWTVALVSFVVSVIAAERPGIGFLTAFIAIFLLWLVLAFIADLRNDHILANRMSELMFQSKSPLLMATLSAFIGGLVAGLAALSASYLTYKKKASKTTVYKKYYA